LGHDRTGLNLRTDGLKSDFQVAGIYLGFGKRNELCFARHRRESSRLPIIFGLLGPFPARGLEIPPDVAWPLQRRSVSTGSVLRRPGGTKTFGLPETNRDRIPSSLARALAWTGRTTTVNIPGTVGRGFALAMTPRDRAIIRYINSRKGIISISIGLTVCGIIFIILTRRYGLSLFIVAAIFPWIENWLRGNKR
jgi:hypothetical protein